MSKEKRVRKIKVCYTYRLFFLLKLLMSFNENFGFTEDNPNTSNTMAKKTKNRVEVILCRSNTNIVSGPIQPLCRIAETLQGPDHLLGFRLFAESSAVKLSFKATFPPKICFRFNIVLVNCRNVFVIYCARVWTRLIYSLLRHRCVSITLRRLKHQHFFTESTVQSSHPFPRSRNYCARVWAR